MRMCIRSFRPQSGSVISKSWSLYVHIFDTGVSKLGRDVDQTSTLGGRSLVEISTNLRHWGVAVWSKFRFKLRPPSVETSTKLRPNFDTPSVEVWSKVARYINGIHTKFDKKKDVYQTATPNFDKISTKLRPPPVSKFGRNFDQTATPQCRSLVWISTKLRHDCVKHYSRTLWSIIKMTHTITYTSIGICCTTCLYAHLYMNPYVYVVGYVLPDSWYASRL